MTTLEADDVLARCESLGWEVLLSRHDGDGEPVRAWMRKGSARIWGKPANTVPEARASLALKVQQWLPSPIQLPG